ncbi:MAG: hypothetical protein KF784_00310 [Fimbriimonadaceae bacterium]|nr:hypothetical protein [Fimbriimonadaceae bacterium]
MWKLFSFWFTAWSGKDHRTGWLLPIWLVSLVYLCSAAQYALTYRSFLGVGFMPHGTWVLWAGLAFLGALVVPLPTKATFYSPLWKIAPIVLLPSLWASLPVLVGAIFVAVAGVLCWIPKPTAQRFFGAFFMLSTAWIGSLLVANIYTHVEARTHSVPMLTWPLQAILGLFGIPSHVSQGMLTYSSETGTQTVLPSLDKFGGQLWITFLVTLVFMAFLYRYEVRAVLRTLGVGFLFGVLWGASVVLYFGSALSPQWWDDGYICLSFALIAPICIFSLGIPKGDRESAMPKSRRYSLAAVGLGAAGALCLVIGWQWPAPGPVKTGVVMVDDSCSDWEAVDEPITTQWFGTRSVYNYSDFYRGLGHYFDVSRNTETITPERLKGVSVLVVKTPTRAYSKESIAAIVDFVQQGGGLWLIGDHTDAFGMTTHLNPIAGEFGFHFRNDAFAEPRDIRTIFEGSPWVHPTARQMNTFLFYTGASILGNWWAQDPVNAGRMLMDDGDTTVGTFFGDFKVQLSERTGFCRASTVVDAGRGRVAVWSDSTLFSNFSIYIPGKMETAVATIDWLRRENGTMPLRPILIALGLGLIGLSLWSGFSPGVAGLWLGLAASATVLGFIVEKGYPQVVERNPIPRVTFYEPEVSYHFPILLTHDKPVEEGYLTAYIAVQRVGLRPTIEYDLDAAMKQSRVIAMIHEHSSPDTDLSRLEQWIRNGGRLLLLDSGGVSKPLQKLLKSAGVHVDSAAKKDGTLPIEKLYTVRLNGKPNRYFVGSQFYLATLRGGQPIVETEGGKTVVVSAKLGTGEIIVSTTSGLFSDTSLGENSSVPSNFQLCAYHLLFEWYRH